MGLIERVENSKTLERRLVLRNRLIEIADEQIGKAGVQGLTARELAKSAECSVGAIYNVFEDMQQLILAVNILTFEKMGKAIVASIKPDEVQSPKERLNAMSVAYLNFALENRKYWKALYEIEMADDKGLPQWYVDKVNDLFALIEIPIAKIYPNEHEDSVKCITRTLFSAVHGIVTLGVERRLMSIPVEKLEGMVTWMLAQAVR